MGSISRRSSRAERAARWLAGSVVGLLLVAGTAQADFSVGDIHPKLTDTALTLSGSFDLGLSNRVEEALAKGIPLDIVIEVRLAKHRTLLWNQSYADWTFRREIRYHALSGQYLVGALVPQTGEGESFLSLSEALAQLGSLNDLILALPHAPESDADYLVTLRASLDIEALPAPLRPVAYTTPAWHLNSGWSTWKVPR
jgi:Domain of unknown function (DUF4390)